MIVEISKDQYEQVKKVLKMSKTESLLEGELIVMDCVEDVWGLYRVKGAWKSLNRYRANMELVEKAQNEIHAKMLAQKNFEEQSKKARNIKIVIEE